MLTKYLNDAPGDAQDKDKILIEFLGMVFKTRAGADVQVGACRAQ
jgi:hypothetical protein